MNSRTKRTGNKRNPHATKSFAHFRHMTGRTNQSAAAAIGQHRVWSHVRPRAKDFRKFATGENVIPVRMVVSMESLRTDRIHLVKTHPILRPAVNACSGFDGIDMPTPTHTHNTDMLDIHAVRTCCDARRTVCEYRTMLHSTRFILRH